MENNAKILQDLLNASKFLNLNEFESDLTNLLTSLDKKESDLNYFFTEIKNNVTKCLEHQIEKKNQVEKELKSMSDELVLERQKCKQYYEEIESLRADLRNLEESKTLYNQKVNEINYCKKQNEQLNGEIISLKSQLDEMKKNHQNQEKDFLEKILVLKSNQQSCVNENQRLKKENLNLIEDIKTILEEKDQVLKELESERIEKNRKKAKLKNELSDLNKKKECFIDEYEYKIDELNSRIENYARENDRLNHSNLMLQNDYSILKQKLKSNLEHMYQLQLKETLKLLDSNTKIDQLDSQNINTDVSLRAYKRESTKEKRYSQPPSIVNLMTLNFSKVNNNDISDSTIKKETTRCNTTGGSSVLVIYPDARGCTNRVRQQVSKYEEILK